MSGRPADVISSGRDPDRSRRLPRRWLLTAAAILIGGGVTAGALLAGSPRHPGPSHRPAAQAKLVPALLRGLPPNINVALGTMLLLAGNDVRLIGTDGMPVKLGWADELLRSSGRSPLGPNPGVQSLEPVPGGFVALLASFSGSGAPALGDVFFIQVSDHRAAVPRLIAHASYMAVAPNGRSVWVQQADPSGRGPGDTWLVDMSGQRLSPVLQLDGQILLAATARGLLTGSAHGGGARLVSPASGATAPMRVPPGAIIAGVSADDVAWQRPPCPRLSCPLHVTSLLTGTDTVITLPPRTETNGEPGAFDPADKRIALPLDTFGRRHLAMATHIYIVDIAGRRVTELPGGPEPLTSAASSRGAITAGLPHFNSVNWSDGSILWIVAADPAGFQAAYWPGAGPLHVLRTWPGEVYLFAVHAVTSTKPH